MGALLPLEYYGSFGILSGGQSTESRAVYQCEQWCCHAKEGEIWAVSARGRDIISAKPTTNIEATDVQPIAAIGNLPWGGMVCA